MMFKLSQFPRLFQGTGDITSIKDIYIIIANLIQIGLIFSGMLAVIFISWSGIQYITSQGDPGRVQSAKNGLRNSIVGLILAGGSFMMVKFFTDQLAK